MLVITVVQLGHMYGFLKIQVYFYLQQQTETFVDVMPKGHHSFN